MRRAAEREDMDPVFGIWAKGCVGVKVRVSGLGGASAQIYLFIAKYVHRKFKNVRQARCVGRLATRQVVYAEEETISEV